MESGVGSLKCPHTRYRENVGGWKDDFYLNGSNDSLNDDLESEFKKSSWRCSKVVERDRP